MTLYNLIIQTGIKSYSNLFESHYSIIAGGYLISLIHNINKGDVFEIFDSEFKIISNDNNLLNEYIPQTGIEDFIKGVVKNVK